MKPNARSRTLPILAAALGLTLAAPLASAADPASEYQTWNRLIKALGDAGYTAVEEIETKLFGRFEVEAVHRDGQEYQLTMTSAAEISSQQVRGPKHASADLIELQALSRVLGWLQQQQYSGLDQIAGDDGLAEIEARNAGGQRQEISLNPVSLQIVTVERD